MVDAVTCASSMDVAAPPLILPYMTSLENSLTTADLPVQLTRFVGRCRELNELVRLVSSARLVTLTGAGGSGKTRLARETASRVSGSYVRVAWVDLAPLSEGALVAQQAATALHLHERSSASPVQALIDAIGVDRVLLVLDNCEHLVDAVATLAESLMRACPALTVIATSREALGIMSETAWLVPPLASAEAVQLFVERAQATLPSFTLTDGNAPAVNDICRRLDGIPLAIELAAARVRVLSPEQIAARLGDAFRLLSSGSRTALPRHRTLRATMEWSFALLAAREQALLRRLSVFAGTFTLDAAEYVCAGELLDVEDILDGVSALVEKSLVGMEPGEGEARYRLLETVRQYGAERLEEAQERELVERRYADWYLNVMEQAAPMLVGGSSQPGLVSRLTADIDNLRAASAWATAHESRAELALRFVGALYWLFYALGQFREARQLTDRALQLQPPGVNPLFRGRALLSSGLAALAQGEYGRAGNDFSAALPLLSEAGDTTGVGTALAKWGAVLLLDGRFDAAVAKLDEAIAYTHDAPANDIARIFARFWRGWAAYEGGNIEVARELVFSNMDVGREYRLPTTLGHSLSTAAYIELARGDVESACVLVKEGLEIEVTAGDGWGIAVALDVVAIIASHRGRDEDAARLLGGIDSHRHRLSAALPGLATRDRERLVLHLRSTLGPRFDRLYAEGSKFTTDMAVGLALGETMRHTTELRAVEAEVLTVPVAQAKLRVLALGPLAVFVGDRFVDPAAWGSARPRELLVYLLMHPDGRTKEQVGLAFWPDASVSQLRNSFHVALHRLRKALGGAEWISLSHERYRVDPDRLETFDVLEFERVVADARRALEAETPGATAALEQALDLFRGDFLDGEPVGDWHLAHRDRLRRLYVDALMELAASFINEDRLEKAVEAYRRVLARDELNEEATTALMRCLAELGERAQALRVYERFTSRLRAELGAKPSDATTRFGERLRQNVSV
jgi:predicted ATPase/DNA-binding SARP family transcriptional activator